VGCRAMNAREPWLLLGGFEAHPLQLAEQDSTGTRSPLALVRGNMNRVDLSSKNTTKQLILWLWALLDGFRTSGNPLQGLEDVVLVGSAWLSDEV